MLLQKLRKEMVELDAFLETHAPDARRSLHRGASERDLTKLSQKLFGGKKLPSVVAAWFSWHNGQTLEGPALLPQYKHSAFYLHSVRDAIAAHASYESVHKHGELSGPWKSQWLPLMAGEFGDDLVLEVSGAAKGCVRACWHESGRREVVADDLLQLFAIVKRQWKKELKQRAADEANAATGLRVPQGWADHRLEKLTAAPTAKALARDPEGTAYLAGPFTHIIPGTHYLVVKLGPGMWVEAYDAPLSHCWESILNDVSKVPSPRWHKDDSHVAFQLHSEMHIFKHRIRRGSVKFQSPA